MNRSNGQIELTERALRAIVKGTGAATGEAFFKALVKNVAKVLGFKYALVAELEELEAAKTLAVWAGEDFGENIVYELSGTPCENVAKQSICLYPNDIQHLFPKDELLVDMGAESYLGAPLIDTQGNTHGLLVVLDDMPMSDTPLAEDILKVFSSRASAELARMKAESETEIYRRHLEELVESRTSELKKAQAELLRKERMAVLGQLIATIAHEVRNPLGTVSNSLFSIKDATENNDQSRLDRAFTLAELNIDRCNTIITELLDYASSHELKKQSTDIDLWLLNMLDELSIPENVGLSTDLVSGATIEIDRELLRRTVVNVLNNAFHAVSNDDKKEKRVKVESRIDENNIVIIFSDNGCGMSEETRLKALEPLFSTKGFGVGLGLSIVKDLIEAHGGTVGLTSTEGEGSVVTLHIPQ